MKWIKIDKENLPEGEVLATCLDAYDGEYEKLLIGRLELNDTDVECVGSRGAYLFYATHYIDPKNIEMP